MPDPRLARILALVEERGLSLRGLSAAAHLSPSYLAMQKKVDGNMSDDAVAALAKVLQVDPAALAPPTVPAPPAAPPTLAAWQQLMPSLLNPRRTFDADALAELAASIRHKGLLQNLVVRRVADQPDLLEIVAGERRYRAIGVLVEQGDWDPRAANIPIKLVEVDDAGHIALAILENLQRQDVNPMEEAEAFATLQRLDPVKYSTAGIAQQIGMTQRHVQVRLTLVNRLAPEAQLALKGGLISLAMARELTLAEPKRQAKLVKDREKYRTAADLRWTVQRDLVPADRAIFDLTAPIVAETIVTDPDGRQMIPKARFEVWQKAAVDRRETEFRARYAWVERLSYFWPQNYRAPTEAAEAGAVIVLHYDGQVEIHEGLAREQQRAASLAEQADRERGWELRRVVTAEAQAARAGFVQAVRDKATRLDTFRIMLFAMLNGQRYDQTVVEGFHGAPPEAFKTPTLQPFGRFMDTGALRTLNLDKIGRAWEAIDKLPLDEVLAAIAELVLANLTDRNTEHLVFRRTAKAMRIEAPALLEEKAVEAEIARRLAEPPAQTDIEDAIDAIAEAAQ